LSCAHYWSYAAPAPAPAPAPAMDGGVQDVVAAAMSWWRRRSACATSAAGTTTDGEDARDAAIVEILAGELRTPPQPQLQSMLPWALPHLGVVVGPPALAAAATPAAATPLPRLPQRAAAHPAVGASRI
jgi:hypothetical protein